MFRLHRHKSEKSGEKIDFKFSHFNALQVPKGWDKLIMSMVSVETGKTTAKSSKALVRNGKCQWTETLSESIWVSQDETSKELEQSLLKLVVSMGSSRSGILGETIINLTSYSSSKTYVPVSLPLKKCNHGTVLQFKLQCLTPRTTLRDAKLQQRTSNVDNMNEEYDDIENKSDTSDSTYTRSIGSSSSNHLAGTSHPGELESRNTSFSASRHSSDSVEGSLERINFSPRNNLNGDNVIGAQESFGSPRNAIYGAGAVDLSRSNHSSFNSKFTGSGSNVQSQRLEFGQNTSDVLGTSSLRDAGSKDLLEAAEDTIEELRAEARMWERNARKLMVDLETLRKELTDQSRNHANLDMELSAAHTERDGLKKEIEQLKILLEEWKMKEMGTENSNFQAEGVTHIQKELEAEIKFQKESSAALALQLQKTQESNLELVSILQELEETIEKQRLELNDLSEVKKKSGDEENNDPGNEDAKNLAADDSSNLALQLQELQESHKELQATVKLLEETLEDKNKELELERNLRKRSLLDIEAERTSKLSAKDEEIIKLEARLSDLLNAQCSHEMTSVGEGNSDLIREIETLKEKVQELEKDCNELTDENLELLFKLKESKKDHLTGGTSFNSSSNKLQASISPSTSEYEVELLRSQIYQLEQEMKKNAAHRDGATADYLKSQVIDLQNKCTDLEIQLQSFQDKAHNLDAQLCNTQVKAEEQELEINTLKQQLQQYQERKKEEDQLEKLELHGSKEMCEFFQELYNQLQLALAHVKKPWYKISSDVNTESENNLEQHPNAADLITQKEQAEAILNKVTDLNKLLEAKIKECEVEFQHTEARHGIKDANVTEAQNNLEECSLKDNSLYLPIQEVENLKMELEAKVADLSKELVAKISENEELKTGLLSKEEEIEALRCCQTEFEAQISNLQKENHELEQNLEIVSRESSITSKCLDEVRNDVMVLSSSLDSHLSANKMLERNSSELESGKRELELHLSELEEENVQLSERISGLEAQLRYLTDEKESGRLELENSKCLATDLKNEIGRLEAEIETQKVELKQKLQDMQKRWSEAQEECEYLKKANPKLQATAESLIEECSTIQRLNRELKKQKLELHERCTHLEAELRESRKSFSECCKKVENLEAAYSSMQEEIASKEKFLNAELDALFHENKENKEKLILEESLLNQRYLEKAVEVENLQREVSHLTEQIGSTHDERERIASNAVLEVSSLRVDKAKLESALQEAQAKVKSSETELHTLQLESRTKVQELISELATSKNNQEMLMADHEKLQRLLDNVKSSEERFKSTVIGLERKLSASEYERQQQVEEVASLKVQLQKIAQLQDEILSQKSSLNEIKFEKSKVEASLQLLSEECEELKAERTSFVEKISSMQMSVPELEDCKRSRVALEEKLLRLEGDLTAKEALCAQDAELKNELNRIKRANSQLQRKVQCLEEEKDECLKRAQALEEELKSKEGKQQRSRSSSKDTLGSESDTDNNILHEELKHSEGDNKYHDNNGKHLVIGADLLSKIELLENALAEALDANEMYKAQLKKLLTDGQQGHANAPKRSTSEGVTVRKTSSLEAELKDLRERYFHMSLRFAEVEAEREELVMKVKSLKSGKRWFS
ncbi:EEIG1/EHBP1 N-terminal domain [Macleaya cordata]|uniref:EEIG1/EHBP1 N-terminal domain n=1 Tax=Macleaya cordata TaxID=56857 RepID=A0A200R5E0_MACCD|nr:EEIG1/EHBP1 N-terminal domain [Macleaya cordata]